MAPTSIDKNALILIGCDLEPKLNGKKFEDLPLADRLRIKRTPIRAIIIKREGDPFIKYELFKRLNTGGALLSPQEIRNCSSRMIEGGSEFYDLIKELAGHDKYKTAIARIPDPDVERRGDEELVLRFFAVKNYLHGYKGNVKEWLDNYMEAVLFKDEEFNSRSESRKFEELFHLIAEKFGSDAFARHKNGEPLGRLAPAYFEAVVGGILPIQAAVREKSSKVLQRSLSKLFESDEFREVTGPGANSIHKLEKRIQLVREVLS